ncbi:Ig-like domain-containing protein [Ohessyouella blattaphilus]|uniref:Ig-like domain-containing protein n=1 Tax=Ohessyouella blattaphilus TaxID=2949333 RepID=A0ABT1EQI4_9FIRM|nr:Ig-like domain-containing protein [Ohessyouella blattaphilus]MCP1111527.1 Ig-like domain-containing protein [Ohessyouella blattaphilus]MCR8564921.1 Ig-like domain-containing protein [Ohessyouella blattaphilus]
MKERKKRALTSLTAVGCAAAVLVAGTFAWQAASSAMNEFSNEQSAESKNPGGNLHDDFDATTGDKNIYVENTGDTSIYVRVMLEEYLNQGENTAEDNQIWTTHIPAAGAVADCGNGAHDAYQEAFQWTMGNTTPYSYNSIVGESGWEGIAEGMSADEISDARKANDQLVADALGSASSTTSTIVDLTSATTAKKQTATAEVIAMSAYTAKSAAEKASFIGWVYDIDGYAYWSQPLAPGSATGLLLDKVSLPLNETYFYAINAVMEYVDRDDLGAWTGAGADGVREITVNDKEQMTASVNDNGNEIKAGSQVGGVTTESSKEAKDMLNELSGSNLEAAGATTELAVGEKAAAPTVTNGNDEEVTVTWESSDPSIVAVDPATGEITGVKEGVATITGTDENGNTVDYTVTVINNEKDLSAVDTPDTMQKGDVEDAPKVVDGENNEVPIVDWISSNPDVVSVDPDTGELTAKAPGTATITGEDENGNKVEFDVTVSDEFTAEPEAVTVEAGQTAAAPAITDVKGNTVNPEDLTWKSSADDKVTVAPDGTINGVAATESPVTVTGTDANGNKVEILVTVTAPGKTAQDIVNETVKDSYQAEETEAETCAIGNDYDFNIIPYYATNPINGCQSQGTMDMNYGEIPLSKLINDGFSADNITFSSTDGKVVKIENGTLYLWYLPTYEEYSTNGWSDGFHPEASVTATYTDPDTGAKATKEVKVGIFYMGTILKI